MIHEYALAIGGRHIVHEDFGGGVVVVNLKTGTYYGLNATAAAVWQLVGRGLSSAGICAHIAGRYGGGADIAGVVATFLDELRGEALIVVTREAAAGPAVEVPGGAPPEFVAPALQRCTDMEELLVLDPIHEVDEMGWPSRPAGQE